MKKLVFCLVGIAALATAACAESKRVTWKDLSPEKRAALLEARRRHSGGMVEIPGKGCIAVFNSQKAVDRSTIDDSIMKLRELARNIAVKYGEEPFALDSAKDTRKKLDAAAAVFVVDNPALPMSLIAVEEGWGLVNVAPLRSGNPPADKLQARFKKEFTRVMALTFSGAKSQYQSSVLQTVQSVADLDKIVGENLCMDTMVPLMTHLADIGVVPGEMISYRSACQRGIAAPPTNDLQKAVWDEIHATPKKPRQIKFDPKTDK